MKTIDHNQQAKDLLNKLGIEFKATFIKNDFHFNGDKDKMDIYSIELKRGNRNVFFEFGQSIMNSQYYKDSIAGRTYTLNNTDSKQAKKTYNAVKEEYLKVCTIFSSNEMEELQEIQ